MVNTLKGWFAPPVFTDEEKTRVARIAHIILLTVLGVGVAFPVVQFIIGTEAAELRFSTTLSIAAVVIIIFLLWTLRRGWTRIASVSIPLLMLAMYSGLLMRPDVPKSVFIGYATVIIVAGLLLGKRAIIVFAGLDIIVLVIIFLVQSNQPAAGGPDFFVDFENLPTIVANLIMMAVLYYVAIATLSGSLKRLRTQETALNERNLELQAIQENLEQQVLARTQRLGLVAALSERLNAILDFDELLLELVNRVKDSFGYYHTHVYVIDEGSQNLVMAAGAGEAGQQMKAEGHHIALAAPTSLVARAARNNQVVAVDNVREAPDWLPNPWLPDTYSEMAVPIVSEGQVVGVLDVQQDSVAGLDESDANMLRSLANQVAVAVRNARLFEQVETALAEAREAQQRYLEQAWDRRLVARRGAGRVQFNLAEAADLPEELLAEARRQALARLEPGVVALNGGQGKSQPAFVAPITLQNVPIGDLQLHGIDPDRSWTEGELALIEAVVDQVAQMAESIRLLNDTQERAGRERLIGQVSDRLRRAPDLDSLMKTAVGELSRILGPDRAFVRFGSETELGAVQTVVPDNGQVTEPEDPAQFEADPAGPVDEL